MTSSSPPITPSTMMMIMFTSESSLARTAATCRRTVRVTTEQDKTNIHLPCSWVFLLFWTHKISQGTNNEARSKGGPCWQAVQSQNVNVGSQIRFNVIWFSKLGVFEMNTEKCVAVVVSRSGGDDGICSGACVCVCVMLVCVHSPRRVEGRT